MIKTLTMLSFLALMLAVSANAQGCNSDNECGYGYVCGPDKSCVFGPGACPGSCGCPGNIQCSCPLNSLDDGYGCNQTNTPGKVPPPHPVNRRSSLIPDTMRPATLAQLLALNRSIAEFYLRKPVDVLVGP